MTWHPISTAPRDGTRAIFYSPGHPNANNENAREPHYRVDAFSPRWPRAMYQLPEAPYTHWQPLPPPPAPTCDTAAFLARIQAAAEAGEPVTADDVARLRRLADWADAPPPAGWNGTLDRQETARAVKAARERMQG